MTADFSGGRLSSEGGALLLRQVEEGLGVSQRVAECFIDLREPELIEHRVKELVSQRLTALALGYEDLNDHGELRRDPLLAAVVGKSDVLGEQRRCEKGRGFALASPATLNRLELEAQFTDRYRKITPREGKVALALLELGVRCLKVPPIWWTGKAQISEKELQTCLQPIAPMTRTSVRKRSIFCLAADVRSSGWPQNSVLPPILYGPGGTGLSARGA